MSAPNKLRGGTNSELTKLKALWRDSLAESARDFWRALFISSATQASIRSQLASKLKINLKRDAQLTEFRSWLDEQDTRDREAERMAEDERRLTETFGDTLNKDQIREQVLHASYARTLATGDFKLGLKTVSADVKAESISLDRDKFQFDAAKACLAKLPELKAISANKELSEDQKLEQARLALFGSAPT